MRCETSTMPAGLSPRVRGHPFQSALYGDKEGSIPACAGASAGRPSRVSRPMVYPRVCGGIAFGLPALAALLGLSPRVRGHHGRGRRADASKRSIPACAGASRAKIPCTTRPTVYPRVCGGIQARFPGQSINRGLSPRVRGHPGRLCQKVLTCGSIPACAGASITFQRKPHQQRVYPRVCGGIRITLSLNP